MIDAPMNVPGQPSDEQVATGQMSQLVERLRDARLSARADLKVSRHVFRGEPSYIVHDPVSFQSHRFSKSDYTVFSRLGRERNLGEVFASLIFDGQVDSNDEQSFYEFVIGLQSRGLLDLPVTDSQRLYERHVKREQMKRKPSLMKLLFLRIPLCNPNLFLDRTVHLARPLFTKAFFVFWVAMMITAGAILITRWGDFYQPFADLLATRNLVILFLVMTALKFWHELGHAYACKINGGAVPDMGAFFMAGMPLAYVDVSSSWSFSNRKQRILVGLGGMYFELIAACIAVFVWAATGPGIINSTAHFVVLMASLMTLLFNANPLMRYDGYYILSDTLGIPNLRDRSTAYTANLVKRLVLGLKTAPTGTSRSEAISLVLFGIAATIYQYWLVLTISMMIASAYFIVGMMIGAGFVFTAILKPAAGMFQYLWFHQETAPVRRRAVGVSTAIICGIAAVICIVPVPGGVIADGQISHQQTQIVRLPFDAVLTGIDTQPGEVVDTEQVLLTFKSDEISDQLELAAAELELARQKMFAAVEISPEAQQAGSLAFENAQQRYNLARSFYDAQFVTAGFDATVRNMPDSKRLGESFPAGSDLIRLGAGNRVVRIVCSSDQVAESQPQRGDTVYVRTSAQYSSYEAVIETVEPAGSNQITMPGLTQLAGGDVILDPATGKATETWFLVTARLTDSEADPGPDDATATVRFQRKFESLGHYGWRHMKLFFNKLFVS
ncbi:MAG: hypothetical protein AAF456_22130 [Planctomycetota bacterium]